jgi:hypothetical protein
MLLMSSESKTLGEITRGLANGCVATVGKIVGHRKCFANSCVICDVLLGLG